MSNKFEKCNIQGQKAGCPHDMEGEILPVKWKELPEKPEFTNCNIIYYTVPKGVLVKNCNVFPKGVEEPEKPLVEPK